METEIALNIAEAVRLVQIISLFSRSFIFLLGYLTLKICRISSADDHLCFINKVFCQSCIEFSSFFAIYCLSLSVDSVRFCYVKGSYYIT